MPVQLPLSDGGDGLVGVVETARGGSRRSADVHDALLRPVTAEYLLLDDGCALVESAQAIGLARLAPEELDPRGAAPVFGPLVRPHCRWALGAPDLAVLRVREARCGRKMLG